MGIVTTFALVIGIISSPALADEAVARGAKKFAACIACHGAKGISQNPLWPNLAGQKKDYLVKQIKDFKAGRRNDPLMTPIAKALLDSDSEEIAAYLSSLEP